MPVTEKVSYTLTSHTQAQIMDLTRDWGFNEANPMPKSRVIAEAIDRAWKAERKLPAKKNGKKS